MSELNIIEQFLNSKLSALNCPVHNGISSSSVFPYITFHEMDSDDKLFIGNARGWTEAIYLVKVWVKDSGFAAADAIYKNVDGALHNQRYSSQTGGDVLSCVRTKPFSSSEIEGQSVFYCRGGYYRIRATTEVL